jgi:hypothetical protein
MADAGVTDYASTLDIPDDTTIPPTDKGDGHFTWKDVLRRLVGHRNDFNSNHRLLTDAHHAKVHHLDHATGGPDALTAGAIGAEAVANKGVANGYASLGSDGKMPTTQLPALAISDTFPVASQAAMLALTAQRGDIAIRSDITQTFMLTSDSPSTLADWVVLEHPDAVTSVDGASGTVVLASDGAAGTATKRTLGAGATQACPGNDSRLSDTRTPTDGSVTTAKLAANAVTSAKVDGTVETTGNKGANSGYMGLDGAGVGAQAPKLHASRHAPGGADDLSASYEKKITWARIHRTTGDLAINNAAWTAVPTIGNLAAIAASVGDVIEISLSSFWSVTGTFIQLDVATIVSGSPVNYVSSGTATPCAIGVAAWRGSSTAPAIGFAGTISYVVQAGDISGGTVTLQLQYKQNSATGSTLAASTALTPLDLFAKVIAA